MVVAIVCRTDAVKPFNLFLVIRHQSEVCTFSGQGKF
jgi:hypothetical protein